MNFWKLFTLRAFRRGRPVLRLVTQGLQAWVNQSCTVGRSMPAVTKIAAHQQDGADAPLALLMVGMIVAFKVTRVTMVRIAPMAMLMIGMMLTRTCGSTEE